MPDNGFEPDDDFFANATTKNAPRHYPNAFRVLAGITAGLFIGGGIWGGAQVAFGMNASAVNSVAPQLLYMSEANYYSDNQKYTTDISALTDGDGKKIALPDGVSATVIGLCDDGWLAKVSGNLGSPVSYVSGTTGSDNASIDSKLSGVTLPSCVTVDTLRKSGVTVKVSDNAVKISNIQIRRSKTVGNDYSGSLEGIHVGWTAASTCQAGMTPQYQLTVQQQKPAGIDIKNPGDAFDLRTFTTSKKAISIDTIVNGGTYDVKVYGSCDGTFSGVAAVTQSYTQPLPAASLKVQYDTYANANGGVFPLVGGSSSNYVSYDIQYKRSYASGWTTLITNYVSGGPVRKDGYYPAYGDEFRARASTFDGKQVGDWGPATTLQYTGF